MVVGTCRTVRVYSSFGSVCCVFDFGFRSDVISLVSSEVRLA